MYIYGEITTIHLHKKGSLTFSCLLPPFYTYYSVGFDIRGDIKIFDFGLAKELTAMTPDDQGLYKLTGMSKYFKTKKEKIIDVVVPFLIHG